MRWVAAILCAILPATSSSKPKSDEGQQIRHVGLVLGWDVSCALGSDRSRFTSCDLTYKSGDMTVSVGVARSVTYTVTKWCGRDAHYPGWSSNGWIDQTAALNGLVTDVYNAAQSVRQCASVRCVKHSEPDVETFENLKSLLLMIRTFPPSPENRGMFAQ